MREKISSQREFKKKFGADVRSKALDTALDARKTEAGLYWTRTAYFWAVNAAALGGYFALPDNPMHPHFLVSCLGLVLSLNWYLANRGSKYWQAKWERQVELLEDKFVGPLYKTSLDRDSFSFWHLLSAYPVSTSRANQALSLFLVFVWFYLAVLAYPNSSPALRSVAPHIFAVATIVFVGATIKDLGSTSHHGDFDVAFELREVRK